MKRCSWWVIAGFALLLLALAGWGAGDVSKHVENLKRSAEQAIEHIIRLIVIFVLQTLVIPLLLLWALYAFVGRVFERPWQGRTAVPA